MDELHYTVDLSETEIQILLNALDAHINHLGRQRANHTTLSEWDEMSDNVLAAEDLYYKLDNTSPTNRKPTW